MLLTGAVAAGLLLAGCNASTMGGSPPVASSGAQSQSQSQSQSRVQTPDLTASLGPATYQRACNDTMSEDFAACYSIVRTSGGGASPDVVNGYGPPDLQTAYNLPSSTGGNGQTIAAIDAYDDPNAEADVAAYRANFGLPACSSSNGCFMKVNQKGQQSSYPTANAGWAVEESLDVDMMSAACPNCKIILVEADDNSFKNLGKSVDEAVKLGANIISNSYGSPGNYKAPKYLQYYSHTGVIITASAGDDGYSPAIPAGYPTVVAVGGTTLRKGGSGRGWTETVWSGTGSGCNSKQTKPTWQTDKGCKGRTMNDVASVSDPSTGVAVYDSYEHNNPWEVVGGTSAASPLIAGIYALAGNANKLNAAQSLYAKGASLYDITSGSNGTCPTKDAYWCNGEVGYDGPTGNGSPNGATAF